MIAPASITVSALWRSFDQHAAEWYRKASGRETRERQNCEHAFRFAIVEFPGMPADEASATWLRQVRQRMIDHGLARTTVNARINRVRRVFRWGVSHELIDASVMPRLASVEPLRKGRCSAREAGGVCAVDESTIAAAAAAASPHVAAMIRVQAIAGLRSGELVSMRGSELDRASSPWLYRPAEHKTQHHGHDRVIPLGPRCQVELEPMLEQLQDDPFLFPGLELERVLFRNGRGRAWTPGTYRAAVLRSCARAGVAAFTPLQLRHAAATRLRRLIGLEAARVVLGHTKVSTTEIYAERDAQAALDAMQLVG